MHDDSVQCRPSARSVYIPMCSLFWYTCTTLGLKKKNLKVHFCSRSTEEALVQKAFKQTHNRWSVLLDSFVDPMHNNRFCAIKQLINNVNLAKLDPRYRTGKGADHRSSILEIVVGRNTSDGRPSFTPKRKDDRYLASFSKVIAWSMAGQSLPSAYGKRHNRYPFASSSGYRSSEFAFWYQYFVCAHTWVIDIECTDDERVQLSSALQPFRKWINHGRVSPCKQLSISISDLHEINYATKLNDAG